MIYNQIVTWTAFAILAMFLSSLMILCVLKQIFHKKKVIFIQLLGSPILPFCLLLLCHKIVEERYSGGVKGMKMHFETPHNEINCVLKDKRIKFH